MSKRGTRTGGRQALASEEKDLPLSVRGIPWKVALDKHWCVSTIWLSSFQRFLSWGQLTELGKPRKCTVSINSLTGHLYSSNQSRFPTSLVCWRQRRFLRERCPSFFLFLKWTHSMGCKDLNRRKGSVDGFQEKQQRKQSFIHSCLGMARHSLAINKREVDSTFSKLYEDVNSL